MTPVDANLIKDLAYRLGQVADGRVKVYLTGGATAVFEGWRESTADVELRLEPEAKEVVRELPELKERLGVDVALASAPDVVPQVPGWQERSPHLFADGNIDLYHFDPYSQALANIERGSADDLDDVRAMIERDLVEPAQLRELYDAIEPELDGQAIDPAAFRAKLDDALA